MGCDQSIGVQPIGPIQPQKRQKIVDFFEQFKPDFQFDSFIDDFSKSFKSVRTQNTQSNSQDQSLWQEIFDKFNDFYLDVDEQLELLEFMAKLIKSRLKQKIVKKKKTFYKQIGQKLEEFEKRLVQKYQLCLKVFKYISRPKSKKEQDLWENSQTKNDQLKEVGLFNQDYLKFNLDFEEAKFVAAKARQLCNYNMDAFSLLSLYLIHSINNLVTAGKSFQQIQSLLLETLKKLEQIYPANESKEKQQQISTGTSLIDITRIKCVQQPQMLVFSRFFKSHFQQLEDYIWEKAQKASQQKENFVELTKSICLEKGYAFKSGVKIASRKNVSSIERTIEKILSNDKFLPILKEWKEANIYLGQTQKRQQKILQTPKGLLQYVQSEKHLIMNKVKQILGQEKSIQFTAKDLLRGKCMFKTVQDIAEAFQKLTLKIEQSGYSIYEVKDRLNKKTRDLTLIINMKEVRAQLQLCLQFDKTANEFNHRIYELMRSVKFTFITNLQIQNQKWTSGFFGQQFEVFANMLRKSEKSMKNKNKIQEEDGVDLTNLKPTIETFVQRFLKQEYLGIDMNQFESSSKASRIVQKAINGLKHIVEKILIGSFQNETDSNHSNDQNQEHVQKGKPKHENQPSNLSTAVDKIQADSVKK